MSRARRSNPSLGFLLTIIAGCAADRTQPLGPVPEALRPPEDAVMSVATHGEGVQIYECVGGKDDVTGFVWSLKAPEATLKNRSGAVIATHYAGPTWAGLDGSTVVGEVVARDAGPDALAIPWLLLRAKSTSGQGQFGAIVWVQRLHTVGGIAPAVGCDAAHAGDQSRVPYSADYDFYVSPH